MDYREKYKATRNFLIITTIALSISLSMPFLIKRKSVFYTPIEKNNTKLDTINEKVLLDYMYLLEIKHSNIVLNQAKLETGNFTSNRFIKYHALFGFQTSDTNIIKYKSWKESLIDYKCWQMKRLKCNEDYYDFLVRVGYAKDSLYIKKLKQF